MIGNFYKLTHKEPRPKKKCIHFTRGWILPCPAHTARNKGSFTPYATLYGVLNPLIPQLYLHFVYTIV